MHNVYLQEQYQREQEKLKKEWEKAQLEVQEEGRKHNEEVQSHADAHAESKASLAACVCVCVFYGVVSFWLFRQLPGEKDPRGDGTALKSNGFRKPAVGPDGDDFVSARTQPDRAGKRRSAAKRPKHLHGERGSACVQAALSPG